MGFNTTVVILNDALHDIASDPEFGKNLAAAITSSFPSKPQWVHAGSHGNAAYVVESHHADHQVLIEVGGNVGKIVKPGERK